MNLTPENKKKLSRWVIGIAATCILIFLGVKNIGAIVSAISWLADIAMPLIVGCAISLILNVPMRFLEDNLWKNSTKPFLCKARRPIAFLISLIMIVGILVGVIVIVLPTLVDTVKLLIQSVIDLVSKFSEMTDEEVLALPFGEFILDINWDQLLDSLKSWLSEQAEGIVNTVFGTVSSLVTSVIDLFVSVAFAIYLLFSKRTLKRQAKRVIRAWMPEKFGKWLIHAISVANVNFRNFISVQFVEAIILGLLCLLGMIIIGFPYAAMISTLVGVTALIPVIGSFIGGGVGAFMILTVDPIKAIWFIVYIIVLQQIEGNVIYPRVMGNRVNLSAMWILAAVTIGGGIGGPVGMLIGVPLASTAYTLFKEATQSRESRAIDGAGEDLTPEAVVDSILTVEEPPTFADEQYAPDQPQINDDLTFTESDGTPQKTSSKKKKNKKSKNTK